MMQATLLNFGDCTRVVCDTMNRPLAINIGEVVDMDIHEAHFHIIKRAIRDDTLMVVPKESRITPKLQDIIGVMKAVETEPYDALMQRFSEVIPFDPDADNAMRPSRDTIRVALRDVARVEVAKMLGMQSRVNIHEEGDAVTRQQPNDDHLLKEIIPETPAPAPAPVKEPEAAKPAKKRAKGNARSSAPKSSKPVVKRERL